jgi:N-acetylneuraminate lyase
MKQKFTGLIAAPFTAMNEDKTLNLNLIKQQADALVEAGVGGAFICGTTGEGFSLSIREREQLAETWMASASPKLKIVVHVGHPVIDEARHLARHAESIKARAFAALVPVSSGVESIEQLVDYCAQIAEAAPGLPFYYYHMPAQTGVDLPMIDFLRAASGRIPNLAGIKFTHENLMDYSRCLNFENGHYNILFGRDEILLAAAAVGATGAVGSTYNYMASIYLEILKAVAANDLECARRLQSVAIEIIAVMIRHGGLPAGKAMMKMIGIDCGPVRPPLKNLSAQTLESLKRELERAGFPIEISNIGKNVSVNDLEVVS